MRLIDAEAVLKKIEEKKNIISTYYEGLEAAAACNTLEAFCAIVRNAPTVDISTFEGCKDCLFYCDNICVDNIMKCKSFDERRKYK